MGCKQGKAQKPENNQFFETGTKKMGSMEGKTVCVTGTTSGTGYILVREVLRLGGRVVMLNRPSCRVEETMERLQELAVSPKMVSNIDCDLQSFASVRKAAKLLNEQLKDDGLDVLVCNAGIIKASVSTKVSVDGYDVIVQTNHLSHFLLTSLVVPLLEIAAKKRGEARVVQHSSMARRGEPIAERYLRKTDGKLSTMFGDKRYQQTKLMNLVFAYALRDKCEADIRYKGKIKSLVAHPGVAQTALWRHSNFAMKAVASTTFQSMADGALGILTCACFPDALTGEFWGPVGMTGAPVSLPESSEDNADKEHKQLLWDVSTEETGAVWPFEPSQGDSSRSVTTAASATSSESGGSSSSIITETSTSTSTSTATTQSALSTGSDVTPAA